MKYIKWISSIVVRRDDTKTENGDQGTSTGNGKNEKMGTKPNLNASLIRNSLAIISFLPIFQFPVPRSRSLLQPNSPFKCSELTFSRK